MRLEKSSAHEAKSTLVFFLNHCSYKPDVLLSFGSPIYIISIGQLLILKTSTVVISSKCSNACSALLCVTESRDANRMSRLAVKVQEDGFRECAAVSIGTSKHGMPICSRGDITQYGNVRVWKPAILLGNESLANV